MISKSCQQVKKKKKKGTIRENLKTHKGKVWKGKQPSSLHFLKKKKKCLCKMAMETEGNQLSAQVYRRSWRYPQAQEHSGLGISLSGAWWDQAVSSSLAMQIHCAKYNNLCYK